MVTIHDVAVRAGVSTTTVSHVINGTRRVSTDLSTRVERAMDELGYQPNALARSLRRKETQTLGLIVPDNSNPFFAEIARGIEDTAYNLGYAVVLCNTDNDTARESLYLNLLLKRQADGIVLVTAGAWNPGLESAVQRNLPLVVVDRELPSAALDCVVTDHVAGGEMATQHLIDLGHRRIGCISGPMQLASSVGRVEGYRTALRAAGLRVDPALIARGDFLETSGVECARALLRQSPPPTAIFACNDLMAIGAISAAYELGLSIPQELSVVGYDDIRLAAHLSPPLTTVAQPKYDLGTIAATLLIERMADRSLPPRRVLLRTELTRRGSTGPPPAS